MKPEVQNRIIKELDQAGETTLVKGGEYEAWVRELLAEHQYPFSEEEDGDNLIIKLELPGVDIKEVEELAPISIDPLTYEDGLATGEAKGYEEALENCQLDYNSGVFDGLNKAVNYLLDRAKRIEDSGQNNLYFMVEILKHLAEDIKGLDND